MLNQAVFSELRVQDMTLVNGIYTEGFGALHDLSEQLATEERRREARREIPAALAESWEIAQLEDLERSIKTNPDPQQGQGSNYPTLVEIRGLEPRTSCMPCKRSSQLSYIPSQKRLRTDKSLAKTSVKWKPKKPGTRSPGFFRACPPAAGGFVLVFVSRAARTHELT